MKNEDLFMVVSIFVVGVIAFCIGSSLSVSNVRSEAIEHGHAHYEVNDKGVTSFVWNSEPPKKKSEKVEKCSCNH